MCPWVSLGGLTVTSSFVHILSDHLRLASSSLHQCVWLCIYLVFHLFVCLIKSFTGQLLPLSGLCYPSGWEGKVEGDKDIILGPIGEPGFFCYLLLFTIFMTLDSSWSLFVSLSTLVN